eukprot:CAMPEP_0174866212 /NCGR_PEP_ID=MMETSP1114-20130205/61696_1 /TAXON_ID=312471 /ORGANISM="Neobodo designis, Strain CCAP 1951/1" /LENGTH=57 /DNA_ID=CAMNT_0016101361 /DNA_START=45 /DNA_END=215 /DNA_ORIENTATION=+
MSYSSWSAAESCVREGGAGVRLVGSTSLGLTDVDVGPDEYSSSPAKRDGASLRSNRL